MTGIGSGRVLGKGGCREGVVVRDSEEAREKKRGGGLGGKHVWAFGWLDCWFLHLGRCWWRGIFGSFGCDNRRGGVVVWWCGNSGLGLSFLWGVDERIQIQRS